MFVRNAYGQYLAGITPQYLLSSDPCNQYLLGISPEYCLLSRIASLIRCINGFLQRAGIILPRSFSLKSHTVKSRHKHHQAAPHQDRISHQWRQTPRDRVLYPPSSLSSPSAGVLLLLLGLRPAPGRGPPFLPFLLFAFGWPEPPPALCERGRAV